MIYITIYFVISRQFRYSILLHEPAPPHYYYIDSAGLLKEMNNVYYFFNDVQYQGEHCN